MLIEGGNLDWHNNYTHVECIRSEVHTLYGTSLVPRPFPLSFHYWWA